jgi:hypothetical protein
VQVVLDVQVTQLLRVELHNVQFFALAV